MTLKEKIENFQEENNYSKYYAPLFCHKDTKVHFVIPKSI